MKAIKAIPIFLMTALCLTSCSHSKKNEDGPRHSYVYTAQAVDIFEPGNQLNLDSVVPCEDTYYVFLERFVMDSTDYSKPVYCVDHDGNIISQIDIDVNINTQGSMVIEDGKLICTNFSDEVEIYDMENESVVSTFRLDSTLGGVCKASDGYVVLAQGCIYKYSEDWLLEKTIYNEEWTWYNGTNNYYENNGRCYLLAGSSMTDYRYYEINFNNETSTLIYDVRADGSRPLGCSGKYVFSANGINKYDFDEGTVISLTDWEHMFLQPPRYQSDIPRYLVVDDNVFLQMFSYQTGSVQLVIYTYDPSQNYSDRTKLTIGGFGVTNDLNLNWAIYKFNTSQDEYFIVEDEYNGKFNFEWTDPNLQLSLMRYFDEGNVPDIFYGDYFDYSSLAVSGDVIDIYPYMVDRVGTEGFDALSDSIEDLMIDDEGHCYYVFSAYQLNGFVGRIDDVGDNGNLSIADVTAIAENSEIPLYSNVFASSIARDAITYSMYSDDGYSADELEEIVNYATTYGIGDYTNYSNVDTITELSSDVLFPGWMAFSPARWYDMEREYRNELVYIGYPSQSGSSHVVLPFGLVAVSSVSEHPDACCDFISMLWDYEVQSICITSCQFPVNDQCLLDYVDYSIDHDAAPADDISYGIYLSYFDELPEDSAERFLAAVYSADALSRHDWGMQAIVEYEVNQYFIDDRSVEDIVDILQSRLAVYLSE